MELNTILITQARMGSKRLPGKVLKKINDLTLLEIHLNRLKKCSSVSEIIVATTINNDDSIIYNNCINWGVSSFRGSEFDVLDRFYQSVKDKSPYWIVRVTSDCPLIDPHLVDNVIEMAIRSNKDYCSNTLIENYPDGQDIEVFKFSALKEAWENANLKSEREHVTPYIIKNSDFKGGKLFSATNFSCKTNYSNIRMTVDEISDFKLVEILIRNLGTDKTWEDYTNYILNNNLTIINGEIIRNEGYLKSLNNDK